MGIVGAVGGFIVGFVLGQAVLSLLLGGGRHLYARENPSIKKGLSALCLAVACGGAWLGYRLLSGA